VTQRGRDGLVSDTVAPVEAEPAEAPVVDGRVARREANRNAVLDAVIELFSEGNLEPAPEEVARRSGVSPRSVYRYYEDREALLRAAIDRRLEAVSPLLVIHGIGRGAFDERLEAFVTARLRLYEEVAATARASRSLGRSSPIIGEQVERTRTVLRAQLEKQFRPELQVLDGRARRARLDAADVLCQLEALDRLRVGRGLSPADTRRVLAEGLRALLTA
jgi:AcrR family transcriptional regulator